MSKTQFNTPIFHTGQSVATVKSSNYQKSKSVEIAPSSVMSSLYSSTGPFFRKHRQLCFGNGKLRDTTIQADYKLRKYPDDRFIEALQSWKVYGNFPVELALSVRTAGFAYH
jgi:hypothetical protein